VDGIEPNYSENRKQIRKNVLCTCNTRNLYTYKV
jgi:hypothetical protein